MTHKGWRVANAFMPSGLFYLNTLDRSISKGRGVCTVKKIRRFYGKVTGNWLPVYLPLLFRAPIELAAIISQNVARVVGLHIRCGSSHPYSALCYVSCPTMPCLAR